MRNLQKYMINFISNQNCIMSTLMISSEHDKAKNSILGTLLSHTLDEWE